MDCPADLSSFECFISSFGVILAYILIAVSALAAIAFPILRLATNPRQAKGAMLGVLALVVVFGISYALSSGEVLPEYEKFEMTPQATKMVGAGLVSFYILTVVAIGLLMFFGIKRIFR
jgi:cellobiose-specific phosphotransferase system component IIC